MIDTKNKKISRSRQCELFGLNRGTTYYKSVPEAVEDIFIKQKLRQLHQKHPVFGVKKFTVMLRREGINIGHNKVRRLLREQNLYYVYPKVRTTVPSRADEKHDYLLSTIEVNKPNQVWATDITYIKLPAGHVYLTVQLDLKSRYILSWKLSNSLDASFCVATLEEAINKYGPPDFANSDQGSQYTGKDYIKVLEANNIKISMAGKGRCFDNIHVERLWKTIKYERLYLKEYKTVGELRADIASFIDEYNFVRPHQSLKYATPSEIYFSRKLKAAA